MVLVLSTCVANHLALQASGIRVETDRTWYLAGEAMKVRVTDDNAIIAYAELCDTYGLARHDAEVSQQLVAVINPLRKSYNDDIEWVRITDSDSLSYSLTSHLSPLTSFQKDPLIGSVRETEGHIIQARI